MLATARTYFQLRFAALFLFGASHNRMTFKLIMFLYVVFHNLSLYDGHQTRKHHAIAGTLCFLKKLI